MKRRSIFIVLVFTFVSLCISGPALAQEDVRAETAAAESHAYSADEDTLVYREPAEASGLQGRIEYEARTIRNEVIDRKTVLLGRAEVRYLDMTLRAEKITVDWDKDLLTAEGVLDSVWVPIEDDGAGDSLRVAQWRGMPEFTEAGDVLRGEVMEFNLRTSKGRVLRGRTQFEDGFYSGRAMKMVKPKTLNVSNARFTTCDLEEDPHFHFWSKRMKIDIDKKVIAKPLVMYIGRIPVLALPFLYFPIQKGRQSGLIIPRYGESTLEGRYLRGLGYYWAASEYWDVKGTVDFYEKSGVMFRGDLNYNLRYRFRGSISGTWTRKNFEVQGTKERRWDLAVRHSQTLSPTANLSVSGLFVSSGNFYREISGNREQRLQQEIRSNATLTKRLGGSRSIQVNLNQTRNLKTGQVTETLPRIVFRGGQSPLIPKPADKGSESVRTRWYHQIYWSYNSQFLYSRTKRREGYGEGVEFEENRGLGWDHDIRLSSTQKLLGWLSFTPGFRVRETWFNQRKSYFWDADSTQIESVDEKGFFSRRTFDLSVSMGTKLYGLFQTRLMKQVQVRHVVTPTLSFSYQPDFSEDRFGYYQRIEDTTGVVQEVDRFSGSLFGSTMRGGRQALNFSLQNLFQMKIGEGENEKKFDLFTWGLSTSYNWRLPEYRLGDLISSIRANPSRSISLTMGMTHSLYDTDESGNRINRLYVRNIAWSKLKSIFGSRWARMTSFRANLTLRLKGSSKGDSGGGSPPQESGVSADELASRPADRLLMDEAVTAFSLPWNLLATLSYSENRYNPLSVNRSCWLRTQLDFNLTKRWKVSYRAQLDLIKGEAVSQDFVFYRDLHCWEARVVWTPTGYNKRFYFKINIKSPMLQDIKFEKGTGRRGFAGSSIQNVLY